ncbi:MAG: 16S rRNA (adenine(1518)-N(6)/adenine(1519)-N(6)) -dimethyltransferase RsmA [Chloroflexota bacterium]
MPQGALLDETLALLRQFQLRPRKALGQNFLIDESVLDTVVAAAELDPQDMIVEVGPGLGLLTERLTRSAGHVVAIELDDDLARVVHTRFVSLGTVQVHNLNVLHADLPALLGPERPFKVVANIPYYITAPILRLFLEGPRRPEVLVLMVQREVAERIAAPPGKMSLLSLSAQVYAEPEVLRTVPASAFYPPPEVQSAVVRLRRRARPIADPALLAVMFRLARAAFHDRRKQLHNALGIGLAHLGPAVIDAALEETGIDRRRRAETLSLDEWTRLAAILRDGGLTAEGAGTIGGDDSGGEDVGQL